MSSQAQFTLSWNSFHQNICTGLCSLQQNEDLVDMTIAADGHLVRVHQLVLSLASPYLKDLIKSAHCQNPVIFLNKISYTSLCSILEYIYTGQTNVDTKNLADLIEAAKALHIKGLKDMEYQTALSKPPIVSHSVSSLKSSNGSNSQQDIQSKSQSHQYSCDLGYQDTKIDSKDEPNDNPVSKRSDHTIQLTEKDSDGVSNGARETSSKRKIPSSDAQIQYSVSNQGNLQMVLNRFVYYLRYTGKFSHRRWRCTDYRKTKCPAAVITKDNIVVQRIHAHKHSFHDKIIAKKVRANSIFSMVRDAEKEGEMLKKNRNGSEEVL